MRRPAAGLLRAAPALAPVDQVGGWVGPGAGGRAGGSGGQRAGPGARWRAGGQFPPLTTRRTRYRRIVPRRSLIAQICGFVRSPQPTVGRARRSTQNSRSLAEKGAAFSPFSARLNSADGRPVIRPQRPAPRRALCDGLLRGRIRHSRITATGNGGNCPARFAATGQIPALGRRCTAADGKCLVKRQKPELTADPCLEWRDLPLGGGGERGAAGYASAVARLPLGQASTTFSAAPPERWQSG